MKFADSPAMSTHVRFSIAGRSVCWYCGLPTLAEQFMLFGGMPICDCCWIGKCRCCGEDINNIPVMLFREANVYRQAFREHYASRHMDVPEVEYAALADALTGGRHPT